MPGSDQAAHGGASAGGGKIKSGLAMKEVQVGMLMQLAGYGASIWVKAVLPCLSRRTGGQAALAWHNAQFRQNIHWLLRLPK
jgi:hypothetical protein